MSNEFYIPRSTSLSRPTNDDPDCLRQQIYLNLSTSFPNHNKSLLSYVSNHASNVGNLNTSRENGNMALSPLSQFSKKLTARSSQLYIEEIDDRDLLGSYAILYQTLSSNLGVGYCLAKVVDNDNIEQRVMAVGDLREESFSGCMVSLETHSIAKAGVDATVSKRGAYAKITPLPDAKSVAGEEEEYVPQVLIIESLLIMEMTQMGVETLIDVQNYAITAQLRLSTINDHTKSEPYEVILFKNRPCPTTMTKAEAKNSWDAINIWSTKLLQYDAPAFNEIREGFSTKFDYINACFRWFYQHSTDYNNIVSNLDSMNGKLTCDSGIVSGDFASNLVRTILERGVRVVAGGENIVWISSKADREQKMIGDGESKFERFIRNRVFTNGGASEIEMRNARTVRLEEETARVREEVETEDRNIILDEEREEATRRGRHLRELRNTVAINERVAINDEGRADIHIRRARQAAEHVAHRELQAFQRLQKLVREREARDEHNLIAARNQEERNAIEGRIREEKRALLLMDGGMKQAMTIVLKEERTRDNKRMAVRRILRNAMLPGVDLRANQLPQQLRVARQQRDVVNTDDNGRRFRNDNNAQEESLAEIWQDGDGAIDEEIKIFVVERRDLATERTEDEAFRDNERDRDLVAIREAEERIIAARALNNNRFRQNQAWENNGLRAAQLRERERVLVEERWENNGLRAAQLREMERQRRPHGHGGQQEDDIGANQVPRERQQREVDGVYFFNERRVKSIRGEGWERHDDRSPLELQGEGFSLEIISIPHFGAEASANLFFECKLITTMATSTTTNKFIGCISLNNIKGADPRTRETAERESVMLQGQQLQNELMRAHGDQVRADEILERIERHRLYNRGVAAPPRQNLIPDRTPPTTRSPVSEFPLREQWYITERQPWSTARRRYLQEFKVNLMMTYQRLNVGGLEVAREDPLVDKSSFLWALYSSIGVDDCLRLILEFVNPEIGFPES